MVWPFDPTLYPTKCGTEMHYDSPFDERKAARAFERMEEIGGKRFRSSPDITHMLVDDSKYIAPLRGIHLDCDSTLPPNSLVPA